MREGGLWLAFTRFFFLGSRGHSDRKRPLSEPFLFCQLAMPTCDDIPAMTPASVTPTLHLQCVSAIQHVLLCIGCEERGTRFPTEKA